MWVVKRDEMKWIERLWAFGVPWSPMSFVFGPLHTQAKSRDHGIVGAQNKVSQGRPNTPPKSCSVVMDPQV